MHLNRPAALAAATLVATLVLTGCATAQPVPVAPLAAPTATAPDATATPGVSAPDPANGTPASPTPEPAPVTPSFGPVKQTPPPEPVLPELSATQQAKFGACVGKRVENWSTGECATLAQQALADAGFLKGDIAKRIDVRGSNAILNYQRSRGIQATGAIDAVTWHALATDQPARSTELPAICTAGGTVICVDQGARTLSYVVDGAVEKVVPVRTGGYAQHAKKKNWRNFPTANGTYKVYDKQKNPYSENYGAGAMPYSIMFHPDMYVHYSSDFAKRGYAASSHGCVNVGDKEAIMWLYENTPIGAIVHVY